MGKYRVIELTALREPEHAVRTAMDDGELESLAESIRVLGVQEPLIVCPKDGDTYEVIAGHRRLLASRMASLVTVPCIIETDPDKIAAIRIHENVEREELNAADEAVFFAELYEKLGEDVDQVAATVRKSRGYVEERLLLMRGYADARDALRAGKISFGVARELNKMHRLEDVAYYLEYAVRTGASIRQMRTWRGEANARAELLEKQKAAEGTEEGAGAPKPELGDLHPSAWSTAKPWQITGSVEHVDCFICGHNDEMWKFLRYFACPACAEKHIQPAQAVAEKRSP